jgi:hypothetical protein
MDRSQPLDVQVVCTSQAPPAILLGKAVRTDETVYEVTPNPDSASVETGETVILDFGDSDSPLVQGTAKVTPEGLLIVHVVRTQDRDRREFPRVTDDLDVRYLVLPPTADDAAVALWLEKGQAPSDAEWHRSGPRVDLSAGGLALDVTPTCREGDRLLVTLVLAPDEALWRGVARVVRLTPLDEAERLERDPASAATHRLSLELVDLPDDARQAILERTIDLLRLPGE